MVKPDDIEVRNPRYAGATIGEFVRALVRPAHPKTHKPTTTAKERRERTSERKRQN